MSREAFPPGLLDGCPEVELYQHLNKCMRRHGSDDTPSEEGAVCFSAWFPFASTLHAATLRIKPCSKTLYRGVAGDWATMGPKYVRGGIVRFCAFTSTSVSAQAAYELSKTFLAEDSEDTIWVFKMCCHTAKDISTYSYYQEEHEWLLHPWSTFTVVTTNKCYIAAAGGEVHSIILTELCDDTPMYVS